MNNSQSVKEPPLVEVRDLRKVYEMSERNLEVLRGVDLRIDSGEMVALIGKSGVGKSTLLHILGTLDSPTSGEVLYHGNDVFGMTQAELAQFRNRNIGFIFQFHHLLPEFTALENVMMPCLIHGENSQKARTNAEDLLERVGLSPRAQHRPAELSGGEQQRVAIARALAMRPRLVLADEPTGNLDTETSDEIHKLLSDLNTATGISFLIATHNPQLANVMHRTLELTRGDVKLLQRGEA